MNHMDTAQRDMIQSLIQRTAAHTGADFYRTLWEGGSRFEYLPVVTRDDFARVPLSRRRYKEGKSMLKIVPHDGRAFFSEWAFDDIASEPWGVKTKRMMVDMVDAYEAIEKSVWCYEHGVVPLIGEPDPAIAAYEAQTLNIDSLITDSVALKRLYPYLSQRKEKLAALTVIDEVPCEDDFFNYAALAESVRHILATPEVGAFAEMTLTHAKRAVYSLLPGIVGEESDGVLVCTKLSNLVTPIIRYKTRCPFNAVL